ncbi:uncharacterized protein V1516DRAFT_656072 [Lipomyces oligophaga]|uniref:uncharacterized protein n=1 Tax=Lipomyces oligophaga TaxID=45792 RepID=UPI0034CFE2AD
MTEFIYTAHPLDTSGIPKAATAIASAKPILDDIEKVWKKGAVYNKYKVQTYSHVYANADGSSSKWFARISIHGGGGDNISWDLFVKGLLENHTENETEYIFNMEKFDYFQTERDDWTGVHVVFKVPMFMNPRDSPEYLLATQPDPDIKEFYIISLPSTRKVYSGHSSARYASIEHVKVLDDGKIKWTLAVTSDEKMALLPAFIQDYVFVKIVTEDVPTFLEWAIKKYGSD